MRRHRPCAGRLPGPHRGAVEDDAEAERGEHTSVVRTFDLGSNGYLQLNDTASCNHTAPKPNISSISSVASASTAAAPRLRCCASPGQPNANAPVQSRAPDAAGNATHATAWFTSRSIDPAARAPTAVLSLARRSTWRRGGSRCGSSSTTPRSVRSTTGRSPGLTRTTPPCRISGWLPRAGAQT